MPPSVRSALGFKREEEDDDDDEEELNCFDLYPVEQFWGSPFCSYYIKGHELGLEGWYVVDLRLMREKWSTKSSPSVWREYVVATVAKTETRDPTGNGYLCFERSEERGPVPETPEGLEEPDRDREKEIYVDKKPYTGRPYPKDYLKYLSYVKNAEERYKYVDRVRLLANPWLERDDVMVAFLQLPPPEPGKPQPKTLQGHSTIKPKSPWLFVSNLVYIARELNRQRELYYIFPRSAQWLAGMMFHVVRIWTGAPVKLHHRDGKHSFTVAPGIDMVTWHKGLQLAAERNQAKDKSLYDLDPVLRVIKLPRNYTIRSLVQKYWHYYTTADVMGMFVKIEIRERNYQIEMERRLKIELAEQQKKVQEAIQRIRVMKEKDPHRKKVVVEKRTKKKTPQEKLKEIKEKRVLRWNEKAIIGGSKRVEANRNAVLKGASATPAPSKPILQPKKDRPTDLNPGTYHMAPTKVWRSQQKALKKAVSNRKSLFRFSLEGPKSRFGLAMFKEREVDKERLKAKEKEKETGKEKEKEKEKKEKETGKEKEKEKKEKATGKIKGKAKDKEKAKEKAKPKEEDKTRNKERGKEMEEKERAPEKGKVEGKQVLAKAKETGRRKMVRWLGSVR